MNVSRVLVQMPGVALTAVLSVGPGGCATPGSEPVSTAAKTEILRSISVE